LFLGKFLLNFLATRSFFSLSLWSLVANACIKACIYFSFWTVHKGEMLAVEDLSVCMKIEMARLLWIHELLLQNDPFFSNRPLFLRIISHRISTLLSLCDM
jgi:hypothetical protein